MPEQLYGLTRRDIAWIRQLKADLTSGKARILRRQESASGPNVQTVKPSSATLDTTDANEDRYPGHWYERDPSTGTLTQMDEVWIVTPNGEEVDADTFYEAAVQHGIENGRPIFCIPTPGTGGGGGGIGFPPITKSASGTTTINSTTYTDITGTSQTFSLSEAMVLVLTFHVRVSIVDGGGSPLCLVAAFLDSGTLTPDSRFTNIGTGGTVGGIVSESFVLALASGSHTIKLQAKMNSTGSGESATVGGYATWVLHN